MNMAMSVKDFFNNIEDVEHNIRPDGTLTAMCRYCCLRNTKHSFDIYSSNPSYDVINFQYYFGDDEAGYILHWLEEKSAKE